MLDWIPVSGNWDFIQKIHELKNKSKKNTWQLISKYLDPPPPLKI